MCSEGIHVLSNSPLLRGALVPHSTHLRVHSKKH
jgi:hypothetical protein